MTSLMSDSDSLASRSDCSTGRRTRSSRSAHSFSNCARESVVSMCLGPSAVAVMKGRLMDVCGSADSSILAFSAASVRRCSACLRRAVAAWLAG
jgi:hypothetical protein